MKKTLLLLFLFANVFLFKQSIFAQVPVITSPTEGQTNVNPLPVIVANSTSTGNTSPNKAETIYFEVSRTPDFNASQPSPDYQKSVLYLKNFDGAVNFTYRPAALRFNTVYYTRAVSSKYGPSAVVSFTTATLLAITSPTEGQTNVNPLPVIVANSTSSDNGQTSETIYFEVSRTPDFNASQPSPDYQKSVLYLKNFDGAVNFTYRPAALRFNTVYYTRAVSSKYGPSAVVSFTTVTLLAITSPTEGQTNVNPLPVIVANSTSSDNGQTSETIYFEVSRTPDFNASQPSPDYQKSVLYLKNFDGAVNFTYRPAALRFNTVYYTRAVSSKYGPSAVVSFTTATLLAITSPTEGQTNVDPRPIIVANSTSTGNTSPNKAETIYFEVSRTPDFNASQPSPDYQKSVLYLKNFDGAVNFTYRPAALRFNTVYYTRAVSSKYGPSAVVSFTIIGIDVTYLALVDGVDATNNDQYANKYITPLTALPDAEANVYDWQFDVDGDFVTTAPFYSVTTIGNVLNLQADLPGFESGQAYYVRVRGRKTGSVPIIGPWSGDDLSSDRIYKFNNALHPLSLLSTDDPNEAPILNVTRGTMKLTSLSVGNATEVVFQIDDDPNFGSPFALPPVNEPNGGRPWLNTTHPGVVGNVFKANLKYYTPGGYNNPVGPLTHWTVEHLYGFTDGTYYVRTRAANVNQTGYWSTIQTVNVDIPDRVNRFMADLGNNKIVVIPDNATELSTSLLRPTVSDDPNYIETSYDFEISTNNFASVIDTFSFYNRSHRSILPTPITKDGKTITLLLLFNTTYQVRVRTYINGSTTEPSDWTYTTFTTQLVPKVKFTSVPASPWASRGVNVYASTQYGIDQYEWQVEKTNTPISSFTKTTPLSYTSFKEYLQAGGQYRIRVRGNATTQGITGAWTNWVSFSVSASAARIASADDIQGAETDLYSQPVLSPNPFSERTTLNVNPGKNNVFIRVTDLRGRVLEELHSTGNEAIELGNRWQKGMYIIQVIDVDSNTLIKTIKAVKQ